MSSWIKSSEHLPEFEKRVLVCYAGGFVTIGWLVSIVRTGPNWNDEAKRGRQAIYWQSRPVAPDE